MEYERAIVKFNGGRGALLCNNCDTIVSYGTDHRDIEHYCNECYDKLTRKLKLLEKTETILRHAKADKLQGVYFICGEGGEKDQMGLPDYIFVCPAFGLDGMASYKKHQDYSAPGY